MIKKLFHDILLLSLFFMWGCSGNASRNDTGESELRISAGLSNAYGVTKSIITSEGFDNGSDIGIYVSGEGYTAEAVSYNKNGDQWESDDPVLLTKSVATIYGYYPSNIVVTQENMAACEIPVSVGNNEKGQYMVGGFDGSMQSDYMYALCSDDPAGGQSPARASKTAPKVNLIFYHGLSCISLIINKGESYGSAGKLTSLALTASLDSIAGEGTMSLENGEISLGSNSSGTIRMTGEVNMNSYSDPSSDEITARVMVVPLEQSQDVKMILKIDGVEYSGTINSAIWQAGKNYEYKITVGGESMEIDSSVKIKGWQSGDPSEVNVE
ncbi:MAG: fimbrillin family protein [Bacteroidales bacterium]|jgi:hypothetical protein|nr:fimbrillin family protein [Bacteroidales bacterium]